MKCFKCGNKLKVIETQTRDGLRRRQYCMTCRFESFVLIPKEIQPTIYNNPGALRFLAGSDGRAVEDIRGRATVWVSGWKSRLHEASGFQLDQAGKDLRETWPRASANYGTLRKDSWTDDQYRINLIHVVENMARDRIMAWESKQTEVADKQAQEPILTKPSRIFPGQIWKIGNNTHTVAFVDSNDENNRVHFRGGAIFCEYEKCLLENSQWTYVGCEG